MIDPVLLNTVQDKVFANTAFWPKKDETFCNLASLAVANDVGCHDFDPAQGKQPLIADEIYMLFRKSPLFRTQRIGDCQNLVNEGNLVFAILPSWRLQQGDGHICSLTTGPGDFSGHWGSFAPLCMNLGRAGTCSRSRGVNWAFQIVPEFFLWVPIVTPNPITNQT